MSTKIARGPDYTKEVSEEPGYVMGFRPDFSLKRTIGVEVPLSDIFTPEKIAFSNKIIEIGRNCFFMEAEEDIKKLLEIISPDDAADAAKALPAATMLCANLKGEAEMYGFTLIRKICSLMTRACDGREKPDIKLALIRELMEALTFSVKKKIKDSGGEEGKLLLANLSPKCSTNEAKPKENVTLNESVLDHV